MADPIMQVTVLVDNAGNDSLLNEWGLSFHISYKGRAYLLDTGGSSAFLQNARQLGIDISDVEAAVLSHAHYDHAGGMGAFFSANQKAVFHVSRSAAGNCWSGSLFSRHYIGIPDGVLEKNAGRIVREDGVRSIADGVWIVPHSSPVPERVARASRLWVRKGLRFIPDDFSHEQSLVFELPDGLVVFNSCSHAGADVIVSEVKAALPGRDILEYWGGLHLFRLTAAEVNTMADRLSRAGIGCIYTGHCTGDEAFEILKSRLGDRVVRFCTGISLTK